MDLFSLDTGGVLQVVCGILVIVVAGLEFDKFHGKRLAQEDLRLE